jgi:hypothetical protein
MSYAKLSEARNVGEVSPFLFVCKHTMLELGCYQPRDQGNNLKRTNHGEVMEPSRYGQDCSLAEREIRK